MMPAFFISPRLRRVWREAAPRRRLTRWRGTVASSHPDAAEQKIKDCCIPGGELASVLVSAGSPEIDVAPVYEGDRIFDDVLVLSAWCVMMLFAV